MLTCILYLLIIYSQFDRSLHDIIDYFSEDFDRNKNCQNKKQMQNNINNNYCSEYPIEEDNHDDIENKFELCRKDLSEKLITACEGKQVKKTGILSYCVIKGILSCCFSNHSCLEWNEIVGINIMKQAEDFLNNRTHYLKHYLIKDVGYKTCHYLKNYDATSCAEDCKLFEKSNFSKSCSEQSGVFKCCIRRDAVCAQCRFCCTLPMCTYKDGTTLFDIPKNINMTSTGRNNKNAKEIYSTDTFIYFYYDYRCLKPTSDKNPEKWKYYDMPKFRAAVNKQDLSKVPAYKFYKLMYNYFDRNVLKKYLSSKGDKVIKKAYGFDYCTKVPFFNLTECSVQCIKAETSKFAKDCRKKKGLFKCCVTPSTVDTFEIINIKHWVKLGLRKKPKRKCLKHNYFKDCFFCCATYACTKLDKKTKKRITKFKTKLKPGKRVGGLRKGIGFRFSLCFNQDYCTTEFLKWEVFIPQIKYHKAVTSRDICKLGTNLRPWYIDNPVMNLMAKGIDMQRYVLDDKDPRINKVQCKACEAIKYKKMIINRKRKCLKNTKKSPFSNINVKTCSPNSLKKIKNKELRIINENLNKIKMEWRKIKERSDEKRSKEKRLKCTTSGNGKNSNKGKSKTYKKCTKDGKSKKKVKRKYKHKIKEKRENF